MKLELERSSGSRLLRFDIEATERHRNSPTGRKQA